MIDLCLVPQMYSARRFAVPLESLPRLVRIDEALRAIPAIAASAQPREAGGAITAEFPRSALKGNPLLWGYAALMLAQDGNRKTVIADHIASDVANGYIYTLRPGKK